MKPIKLRPHHIDHLVSREQMTKKKSKAIIELTAELYGDYDFAYNERKFIESAKDNMLIKVVLENDYICNQLKCPFSDKCAVEDYASVAKTIASRLPYGPARDLAGRMTPLISDKWALRRYGLKVDKTYKLGDIIVINHDMKIDNL